MTLKGSSKLVIIIRSKLEVPRDVRNFKSVNMKVQEKMVSTLEQMQVPNGTGTSDRRSKCPFFASRACSNVLWKSLRNLVIRSKSVIRPSSVIRAQIGKLSDQLRVSLFMVMSQNVM